MNKIQKPHEISLVLSDTYWAASDVSHQLFILYRVDRHLGVSDSPRMECKSPHVLKTLAHRYNTLELREAEALFFTCNSSPLSSPLSGWIFEKMAISYIGGYGWEDRGVVKSFHLMHPDEDDPLSYRHQFSDAGEVLHIIGPNITIKAPGNTTVVKSVSASAPSPDHSALPIGPREVVVITDIVQLDTRDDSKYYVLAAHNNPLFDAYFFTHEVDNTPTLWVIQVTSARKHGGSARGYDLLREGRSSGIATAKGEVCADRTGERQWCGGVDAP